MMFKATNTKFAPWYIIRSDDKRRAPQLYRAYPEVNPVQESSASKGQVAQEIREEEIRRSKNTGRKKFDSRKVLIAGNSAAQILGSTPWKYLLANLLLASANVAAAQGLPTIDIEPSCRAAARGDAGMSQDYGGCRKSEEAARDILVKQWNSFLVSDCGSCYRLTTTSTPGTHTELLSCLEMRRDARELPDPDKIRKRLGN